MNRLPLTKQAKARAAWASAIALALSAMAAAALAGMGAFELTGFRSEKLGPQAVTVSYAELDIDIVGGYAEVTLRQIFKNNTDKPAEGSYYLKLAPDSVLSDFGVWDGGRWTEAAVIERERARRAYDDIVSSMVDPALVETPDAGMTDAFKVRVAPIPAYGTRRVEASFHQWLPVINGKRHFLLPMRPGPSFAPDGAEKFVATVKVSDTCPLAPPVIAAPESMGLEFEKTGGENGDCAYIARADTGPVTFGRDLDILVPALPPESSLEVSTYRDPDLVWQDLSPSGGETYREESGFFLAEAIFNFDKASALEGATGETAGDAPLPDEGRSGGRPLDLVVIFDMSLSMQFQKLEKAVEVLDAVLDNTNPADRIGIVAFGSEPSAWRGKLVPADADAKRSARLFLLGRPLAGGTRPAPALAMALEMLDDGSTASAAKIVVITDGRSSLGPLGNADLADEVSRALEGRSRSVSLNFFGIGEDANAAAMSEMARRGGGYFTWARETEDLSIKLESFLAALRDEPAKGVTLAADPVTAVYSAYPGVGINVFDRQSAAWVGKYEKPAESAVIRVSGERAGATVAVEKNVRLPEKSAQDRHIARLWAERRVEALLASIDREGEDKKYVDEIVTLSKKYKFPTPYTSFLAAPRALLQPKVMRPRDPILQVRAPEGTSSVTALFPFGEAKAMRRIEAEQGLWETRFLVPQWMDDGVYYCRLVLVDAAGRASMELKSFRVDGKPPSPRVTLADKPVFPGDAVEVLVDSDPDTRTIKAGIAGLPAVDVRWDAERGMSVGLLTVPPSLPPGSYEVRVWAEDFAHNITSVRTELRVGG